MGNHSISKTKIHRGKDGVLPKLILFLNGATPDSLKETESQNKMLALVHSYNGIFFLFTQSLLHTTMYKGSLVLANDLCEFLKRWISS